MDNELFLCHYGTPRHSGRYPYGSGENPYQHDKNFLGRIDRLRKAGMQDNDIAKSMGLNSSQYRKKIALATDEVKRYEASEALRLYNKGMTKSAIARRMGKNESSVRQLLNPALSQRRELTRQNAQVLKEAIDEKNFIDVGKGVEQYLGISETRMKNCVQYLQNEGYVLYNNVKVQQLGTGKDTTYKVLCKPGTEFSDVIQNKDQISVPFNLHTEEGKLRKRESPVSIDSNRVEICYAEDGGKEKDGVIELRRGVQDISLANARYAQVRIAVDGTHYLKGMAVYADDLPDGVDIRFNTNKHKGTPKMDVLKPMKDDPDNPFGASIKDDDQLIRCQRHYPDADGKEHLSALNIVAEEGTWSTWGKNLSSQFLSKQSPALAKKQLAENYTLMKEELDEIRNVYNPTVRAELLNQFAGKCDSDATDLHAAALPRQSTKVLLPIPEMKETEVYAPGYRDGETVALVRHPHGGIFEIPVLTVNNKQKNAKNVIGEGIDAVGINSKVAAQLSGADFDGDSVLVLPVDNVKIRSKPYLSGLKDFDPKEQYPGYEGMHVMTDHEKGLEMGKVSNLITDMTIKGASESEICRAVKHSMVVIDAQKHELDYKRSESDNGIAELREKYQGSKGGGASTIVSKSTSESYLPERKIKLAKSKMTTEELEAWQEGKMVYENTNRTYNKPKKNSEGEVVEWVKTGKLEKVPKMMLTEDAYDLVSGGSRENTTRIERVYADYANQMKALAQQARKEARSLTDIPYEPSARATYAKEVGELDAALRLAKRNAPLERQAQLIARENYKAKLKSNPNLDDEHEKRLKGQELDYARKIVGAKKQQIHVTDKQWEAINAGAITKSMLKEIIANSDSDRLKELATPRNDKGLSTSRIQRAKTMLANGHTQADVADALGISVSTLQKAIR